MFNLVIENSFDRDYKRELKSGLDKQAILSVIDELQAQNPLEEKHRDHSLKGDYAGFRECHIKPDLLLIYQIKINNLHLEWEQKRKNQSKKTSK